MVDHGAAEYKALSFAMQHVTPECSNDPRFILDASEIQPDELDHLALTICRRCPLKDLCRAYGDTERPKAGIWGGRTYRGHTKGTT